MQPKIAFKTGEMVTLMEYERWMKLVTGTEQPHLLAKDDSRVKACYHRFNVGKWNAKNNDWDEPIKLDDWKNMATMVALTAEYLGQPDVKKDVQLCADQISLKA
jgi:hypothetical protein